MSSRPVERITVAICTWNRSESLGETLEQFTRVRVPDGSEWELLVVNNCCTDDTDSVVKSFQGRLPIRLLHEPLAGLSHARNLAIREATGSYLAWTDDDVLADPGWLDSIMSAFSRFDADWVFGRSIPKWLTGAPRWYSDRFKGHFALLDYGPEPFVVTDPAQEFFGLNFAGTRDAHLRLRGFRAEFGFRGVGGGVGEDTDMFERALAAGMRVVYTPDAVVQHMIPWTRTTKRYHRTRCWLSNEVIYDHLPELYPSVRMLLGMPRFLFGKALDDILRYTRALLTGNSSERFFFELKLVSFARLALEAARRGFRPGQPPPPALPTSTDHE
jgi:glycosyltransferase involved in cell wall biosynthesis